MKVRTLVIGAFIVAGLFCVERYVNDLYTVSTVDGKPVTITSAPSSLTDMGYTVSVASGSNAIYTRGDNDQLFVGEQELYADDQLSEKSSMEVYGNITLGDSEDKVIKYYGEPVFDLGNGKLYARYMADGSTIYIGTLDGKVIHTEVNNVPR